MIKHDSQGFLVGDLVDATSRLADGQERGLQTLARIDRNVASLAGGHMSGRGGGSVSRRSPSSSGPVRVVEPTGRGYAASRGGSSSANDSSMPRAVAQTVANEVARAVTRTQATRAAAITQIKRDAGGRFVKRGGAGAPSGATSSGKGSSSSGGGGFISTAASNIKDAASNAGSGLDPVVGAVGELKQVLEPLGRGWKYAFGRTGEQKKERWYKRFLKAMEKKPTGLQATVASSGGSDDGIGGGLMGLIGLALPSIAAAVLPVLALGGALLAGLGIGKLINDWLNESGTSEKIFKAIDSMIEAWDSGVKYIKDGWNGMVSSISDAWNGLVKGVAEKFGIARDFIGKIMTKPKEIMNDVKKGYEGGSDAGGGRSSSDAAKSDPRRVDGGSKTSKPIAQVIGEKAASADHAYIAANATVGSALEKVLPNGFRHRATFDGVSGGVGLERNGSYTDAEAQNIKSLKSSGSNTGAFAPGQMPDDVRMKIEARAKANGLDPNTMLKIAAMESGGNANAVSSTGAIGIYQFTGKTASGVGITDRFNADQNIEGGMKLAKQNQQVLINKKLPVTPENIYMVHQLGPKAAVEVIRGAQAGLPMKDLSPETQGGMHLNYGAKEKTAASYVEANAKALESRYKPSNNTLAMNAYGPTGSQSLASPTIPASTVAKIPPAPDASQPMAQTLSKPDKPVVIVSKEVGQNVSDRNIAHKVTGGMGST